MSVVRGKWFKGRLLLLILNTSTLLFSAAPISLSDAAQCGYDMKNRYKVQNRVFTSFFKDFLLINRNLFTRRSILAFSGFLPAYIGVRRADSAIHHRFYDCENHRDINQVSDTVCNLFGDEGIAAPIVFLSSLTFLATDERLRHTSEMFAKAVVAFQLTKKIIKESLKHECNVRPLCGRFEKQKTYGGFPSGHMGASTMMALMYGIRHGKAWGVPLGAYAIANFAVGLNCNRHFASQLILGAGLGAAYAFAALQTIDAKYGELECGMTADKYGNAALQLNYSF